MKNTLLIYSFSLAFALMAAASDPSKPNLRRKLETSLPPTTTTTTEPVTESPTKPTKPPADVNAETISENFFVKASMDAIDIADFLPHHHPFLFVEKVLKLNVEEGTAIGIKTVSVNDPQFAGNFPNNPNMPGILQTEALAQLAEIVIKKQNKTFNAETPFSLVSFNGVNWGRPVSPGDILVMEITSVKVNIKAGMAKVSGRAYVDGELAVDIKEMSLQAQYQIMESDDPIKEKLARLNDP